jgi:hypothetical protein
MAPPARDLPRDWMVTRCASGGCVNLHLERTVVQLTPAETVALARLLAAAVRQYGLADPAGSDDPTPRPH